MGKHYTQMRFKSVMYNNADNVRKSKKKDSVYDFHKKLQACTHLNTVQPVKPTNFKSPVPAQTFDTVRGASP